MEFFCISSSTGQVNIKGKGSPTLWFGLVFETSRNFWAIIGFASNVSQKCQLHLEPHTCQSQKSFCFQCNVFLQQKKFYWSLFQVPCSLFVFYECNGQRCNNGEVMSSDHHVIGSGFADDVNVINVTATDFHHQSILLRNCPFHLSFRGLRKSITIFGIHQRELRVKKSAKSAHERPKAISNENPRYLT